MKKEGFTNIKKVCALIDEIELDFIEWVEKDMDERKKLIPITEPRRIKSLIYNLLSSDKYRGKINLNEYNLILDVYYERLYESQTTKELFLRLVRKLFISKKKFNQPNQ